MERFLAKYGLRLLGILFAGGSAIVADIRQKEYTRKYVEKEFRNIKKEYSKRNDRKEVIDIEFKELQ